MEKLHAITPQQAEFMYQRSGNVFIMSQPSLYSSRERPINYTAADMIDRKPGLATRREINKFKKIYEDFPADMRAKNPTANKTQNFRRSKKKYKSARTAWADIAKRTGLVPADVTSTPHTKAFWVFSIRKKNPILTGYSKATVSRNIARLRDEGKSATQASAIALNSARKAWQKRHGKKAFPAHLVARFSVSKKRRARKVNPVNTVKNPALYMAYVKTDEGKKFYYAGLNPNNDAVKMNDDITRAALFNSPVIARTTVQWVLIGIYGQSKLNAIGPIYTQRWIPPTRQKNPISSRAAKQKKIVSAIQLFEDFRGGSPEYIDTVDLPTPEVGMKIGKCDGVLYTTVRDGVKEKYIHKFKVKSRPLLATSFDGKHLLLIGGSYRFTERGIVDK